MRTRAARPTGGQNLLSDAERTAVRVQFEEIAGQMGGSANDEQQFSDLRVRKTVYWMRGRSDEDIPSRISTAPQYTTPTPLPRCGRGGGTDG